MAAALEAGLVQAHIEETWRRRSGDLARRADTLVGVSDFPNLEDRIPPVSDPNDPIPPVSDGRDGARAAAPASGGLASRRYAEAFEALRARTDEHERITGTRPSVLLVCLGPPSAFTARATYAKSFFETAGLPTVTQDAGDPPEAAAVRAALAESGATIACLCSSDTLYSERGADALAALPGSDLARTYVAARPGELADSLLASGADELVYAGCDVLEVLTRTLDVVGVR
jgi:methylmalonyl-CoA mutase